jgi:hypothetical protein
MAVFIGSNKYYLHHSMIFAFLWCRIWSPLSNEIGQRLILSLVWTKLAPFYETWSRFGILLLYDFFLRRPRIVKDIAKSVPIMGKTTDFEFPYFSAPLSGLERKH